jgi:RHH-type rel operon transcriptional repressor/antitoxin RelB
MSTKLIIRLSNVIAEKLSEIAEETERSKSYHIQTALELYLAELADLQVAYDRLQDASAPATSIEDMRNDLEL